MAFTKITSADTTGKGVIGLPDEPGLSASQMQQKLDQLALEVIIPKFNGLVEDLNEVVGNITLITVPTTAWENNTHATYTKKAVIETDKFSDTFVPVAVDLIPTDGTAFYSSGEEDALGILNPLVDFSDTAVTFYASDTPSVSLKFRIRGGDE